MLTICYPANSIKYEQINRSLCPHTAIPLRSKTLSYVLMEKSMNEFNEVALQNFHFSSRFHSILFKIIYSMHSIKSNSIHHYHQIKNFDDTFLANQPSCFEFPYQINKKHHHKRTPTHPPPPQSCQSATSATDRTHFQLSLNLHFLSVT